METTPSRNLLIVQTIPEQDPADWVAVKENIERKAPDIEVRISTNGQLNSKTSRWQVRRPSLVFSPVRIADSLRGGTVYCGRILGKDVQLRRLADIGISTPKTAIFTSLRDYDPAEWGEYVIIKPNYANSGNGVKLVRTIDLAARREELTAGINDQFRVETYIDHSEDGYPTEYRVMSMFGRVLYCARNRWGARRPPLADIAADPSGIIASNGAAAGGHVRTLCNDPEIIALGERAHKAFPESPVIGVDIIRDSQSGRLYVLEANPHGAVWHFSSAFARKIDPEYARDRYAQFNALERAAELLIERTRADAS